MTLGALACTGNAGKRGGAGVPLSHVSHEPFDGYYGPDVNTPDLLEQRLNDPSSGIDPPAAILVETVQGDGGLNVASPAWLRQTARTAKEQRALLIITAIQQASGPPAGLFTYKKPGLSPATRAL